MRDLKFRIWDSFNAVMMRQEEDRYADSLCKIWVDYDILINGENDPIMMQFTGLTDRNGIEIYEGDIMSYKNSFPEDDNKNYFIVWNENGYWAIRYKHWDKKTTCRIDAFQRENGEVIGNIYENPELL